MRRLIATALLALSLSACIPPADPVAFLNALQADYAECGMTCVLDDLVQLAETGNEFDN